MERLDLRMLEILDRGDGKLDVDAWHTCETTHCRAGWTTKLAGEAGAALEARVGPKHAGEMIYAGVVLRADIPAPPPLAPRNERRSTARVGVLPLTTHTEAGGVQKWERCRNRSSSRALTRWRCRTRWEEKVADAAAWNLP